MFCLITSWWKWLAVVIFFGGKENFVFLVPQQSHLCQIGDMPCEPGKDGICLMKYFKLNSTDCRDMTFDSKSDATGNTLGSVEIKPYVFNLFSYKQTAFNLTFSNVTWENFKFRFKQEGNEMKNTCREFHMTPNSTISSMFYDCVWSNERYEGKSFIFEYEAQNSKHSFYKKYFFQVPFAKNIDDTTVLDHLEIFLLVEQHRNAFGLNTFILQWEPLPEKYSINAYNVSVFTNNSGRLEVVHYTKITCDNKEMCKYHYHKWFGKVQFGIQPYCLNKSDCLLSTSVVFHLGGESTQMLLIGMVSITVVIPAFIYILFLIRNYLVKKSKKWIYPVPKLLIIYTPSLSCHVNVVLGLAEYLKSYCNIEPLVDELHIFESNSRDPFKWCNETFKAADHVMVVASPYQKYLRLADSVYKNTDVLLLRLLQERLSSRDHKTKFFVLMLPYCTDKDIPSEAINLIKFSFPENLNKMLRYIHNKNSFADCIGLEIQGGKENYKLFGAQLNNSITETQITLKKNKLEYEKIISEMQSEKDSNIKETLLPRLKREKSEQFKLKERRTVVEIAEDIFSEFPGRLDDLNLSGEESECLVEPHKRCSRNEIVNLDILDL